MVFVHFNTYSLVLRNPSIQFHRLMKKIFSGARNSLASSSCAYRAHLPRRPKALSLHWRRLLGSPQAPCLLRAPRNADQTDKNKSRTNDPPQREALKLPGERFARKYRRSLLGPALAASWKRTFLQPGQGRAGLCLHLHFFVAK